MIHGDPNWSEDYRYCRTCYKTTHNHAMEGYCQKCFNNMEIDKKKKEQIRDCLKCGKEFISSGIGNRRCDMCLKKSASVKYRHKINMNN